MHPHLKMFAGALLVWTFLESEVPAQSLDSGANPKARVPPQITTATPAMPPVPPSPVDYFRKLIEASPAERGRLLEGKTPDHYRVLTNSLRTYLELPVAEREARLHTLDVRFYLIPLLQSPATNRQQALSAVPELYRQIVRERLAAWDRLPAAERQNLIEKEGASRLASVIAPQMPPMPQGLQLPRGTNQVRVPDKAWQKYPDAKRPLTPAERATIEKALEKFRTLPAAQRVLVLNSFKKLADLSSDERRQFLRNAEAWQAMSAEERERWRHLVNNLPQLPPLPPGFGSPSMPPVPPSPGAATKVAPSGMIVGTNSMPVSNQ